MSAPDPNYVPNPPAGMLTINGFCRVYNIGRTRAYDEIGAGRLKAVKLGRGTRIRRVDAEAWASALPPALTPAAKRAAAQ